MILVVVLQSIRKLGKYCEYVGILLTAGLGASVLYSMVTHIASASKYLTFLRGWSFACVEIMLVNQFSRFSLKIIMALISFGLRFGCIGSEDPNIFTGDILLRNILFEVLLLYIFYKFERKERSLFAKLYELQEEMRSVKSLLGQSFRRESLAIIDYNQKILFCNNRYGELLGSLGVKSSSILIMGNQLMIDPDSLKLKNHATIGAFNEVLTLNEFIQNLICNQFYGSQTWLVSGSCEIEGECHDFDITITSIMWEKIPSIAIVLDDDDDVHKKEIMALRQADENKDLLIATVSHELRTPLHGILGLIQVVESKTKEEGILEHLSLCKDNANLLLNLVNSLLDLQQIQHGEVKLNPSQVHLHSLVYSITRLFSFIAHEKNVELCVRIEENVPQYIITDEGRLKQILINLVSNALKFTFSGNITICVSEDLENTDHLKFSVLDTGIGIKKEQQSKLFKLYTKLDDKEGMNKNGVGLGLTICNSIVKLLSDVENNRIVVKSEYGFGSSFSFSIHKNLGLIIKTAEIKNTFQASNENISDFEESSKPLNIKAKLSLYSSLKNMSLKGLSVSKLSTFYEKKNFVNTVDELTGLSPQGQSNKYNNITSINVMKFGKSETHFENPKGAILVVDDNSLNLLIARNFLEGEGYQVQTALNGQQAIEKVEILAKEGGAFSCILMDGQMPIMDGYETTRILKKMMESGKVTWTPIIALTASNDEKTIKKCFGCGMDEYLCKPLIKGDLFRMLLKFEGATVGTTPVGGE